MNVALPSLVTRVRSSVAPAFSVQVLTGGSQSFIAQNGPINDQTAETVALTSAVRESVAADAGDRVIQASAPRITRRSRAALMRWLCIDIVLYLNCGRGPRVMAQVEPCGLRSQLTQLELHGAALPVQEMNRPCTDTALGVLPIVRVVFPRPSGGGTDDNRQIQAVLPGSHGCTDVVDALDVCFVARTDRGTAPIGTTPV